MDRRPLSLPEFDKDPLAEFKKWRDLAAKAGNRDVDAMTLATADSKGRPSARVVLYKGIASGGFVFYTNYESFKAREIGGNPHAALVFYWPEIYRQVRVEGAVKKMSRSDSEAYFKTRPRESQLGAWASHQSQPVQSFESLEEKFSQVEKEYEGKEIPCPPHWGGFVVMPAKIEFWVGGTRRLHQRVCFTADGRNWKISLLSP